MPPPSRVTATYLAAIMEPSTHGDGFRVKGFSLDRITLAQRLINICLSNPEQCYSNTLNLSAWILAKLPTLYSRHSSDPGAPRKLPDSWWESYMSDDNFNTNLVDALEAYLHYPQLLVTLRERPGPLVDSGYLELLSVRRHVELYTLLVARATSIVGTKMRHRGAVKGDLFSLDSALRRILQIVRQQIRSLGPQDLVAVYGEFEAQIRSALRCLHQIGVEALYPRSGYVQEGHSEEAEVDDEIQTGLPRNIEEECTVICTNLRGGYEACYGALTFVHQKSPMWYEEAAQVLSQSERAAFLQRLGECLNLPDTFELISGILMSMVDLKSWWADIRSSRILEVYVTAGTQRLTESPDLARLDLYLRVWSACRPHVQESTHMDEVVAAMERMGPAVLDCIRTVNINAQETYAVQNWPSLPSLALKQYVAQLVGRDHVAEELRRELYSELKVSEARRNELWASV